jgi:uncharacterized protein YdgA (DUF945 family)
MKKVATITISALGIILLLLVAPGIQGFRVESRLHDTIKSANSAVGWGMRISIKSYERGWFRSKMTVVFSSGSDDKSAIAVPVDILHGPLPIMEIVRGKMSVRFFDAYIISSFTPPISNEVVKKTLAFQHKFLFTATATFHIDGSIRAEIETPKISTPDNRFTSKGGALKLTIGKKSKDLKLDLLYGGFSLRDKNHATTITMGEMNWRLHTLNGLSSFDSNFSFENYYREYQGSLFEIKDIKTDINLERGKDNLFYGNASASVATMRYQVPNLGLNVNVNKILFHAKSDLQEERYQIVARGRIQEVTMSDALYGPFAYSIAVRRLNPEALDKALSKINFLHDIYLNVEDKLDQKSKDRILEAVSILSKGLPRFETSINFRKGSDRGILGAFLVLDEQQFTKVKTLNELVDAVIGNVNFQFSKPLIRDLWERTIAIDAKTNQKQERDTPDKIETVLNNQFMYLSRAKLLVEQGDNYVAKIDCDRGKITINRLPLDLFRILHDIAIKNPSEIIVGFGSLGVRGGLTLSDVRPPIASIVKGLTSCVKEEMDKSQMHPFGVVHVKWEITKTGEAVSPNIIYSTVVNPTLESCTLSLFPPLKFPASNRDTKAILAISFGLKDIAHPPAGFNFGMYHHYKNPFPVGTSYTVGLAMP